ncbi:C-type lectin domain family 14 member A [Toxotes jaculatrix]|uniref:C-type lectin domain family 14 member A n=1 Tax=Toxotes jaculatrix TaxID=941984 RepID=UPI001B3AD2AC|nr:C-type lectin domain family 14 member A [Toxotes jaculatrix]XP_040916351.1 C-type lectin domain family 14 member A [Toxotes jaculatrix]
MALWFSSCWIYLWIIVLPRIVSADSASPPHYSIHRTHVSFDQAMEGCSPGVLTTLATEQEVANVLRLISETALPQNEFTFWVGLRKAKNECVVTTLPLRGFKWLEDGSEESQVSRWVKEPADTCTTTRCAVLKGELDGLTVTSWGLIPVTCKNTYQFICKLRHEQRRQTFKDIKSTIEPVTLEPPTETNLTRKTKPELQGPDPGPGSKPEPGWHSCQPLRMPEARFLIPDPDNSSRIRVECWSSVQLEIHCWGQPAAWRLLNDSPVNFTTVCQPCSDGFQKDAFGNCVDIDECSVSAACSHTCLNTEGSYRCICSDKNGDHHDEGSLACTVMADDRGSLSGILVPVLVSVVALVVLVMFVVVMVKCCLMRRSKMDGQDSFSSANEKTAT